MRTELGLGRVAVHAVLATYYLFFVPGTTV
jgi:hypothetical protein